MSDDAALLVIPAKAGIQNRRRCRVRLGPRVRGDDGERAAVATPGLARRALYCIYLVNEPVQKLLGVTLAIAVRGNAALFTALWIPSAVLLPILASWWLHERIERPAQRYGRGMALAAVTAG